MASSLTYYIYCIYLFFFLSITNIRGYLDNDLLEKTQTFSKTGKYMKQKEEMTIDFLKQIKSFEFEYIMTEFDKR